MAKKNNSLLGVDFYIVVWTGGFDPMSFKCTPDKEEAESLYNSWKQLKDYGDRGENDSVELLHIVDYLVVDHLVS